MKSVGITIANAVLLACPAFCSIPLFGQTGITNATTHARPVSKLTDLPPATAPTITARRQVVDLRYSAGRPPATVDSPSIQSPSSAASSARLTATTTDRTQPQRQVLAAADGTANPPGSPAWVDAAIPAPYFDQAQILPNQQLVNPALPDLHPPAAPATSPTAASAAGQTSSVESSIVAPHAVSPTDENPASGQPVSSGAVSKTEASTPNRPNGAVAPDAAIPDWVKIEAGTNLQVYDTTPKSLIIEVPQAGPVHGDAPQVPTLPDDDWRPQFPQSSPTMGVEAGGNDPTASQNKRRIVPEFNLPEYHPAHIDSTTQKVEYSPTDFGPEGGPAGNTFDPEAAAHVYRGKFSVPVQRPLIELWRPLYTGGIYPPAKNWLGVSNPMKPHFLVYGDARTAIGVNNNAAGQSHVWGNVLNLDMDLQLTSTERIHAFVSPLNRATLPTGLAFNDPVDLLDGTNFNFNTLFFEGDAGALLGGARGIYPPFDLPFTFGLIPLVYQNGIWANDAMLGAAVALPARHSRRLKWSNYDATFFCAFDNVTTDAFATQDSSADVFGSAWFIDAYEGYIEANYAFVSDDSGRIGIDGDHSYHNISLAFTRRYLSRLSNSVRFILNTGQEQLAKQDRTADGHLLLIENSLVSAYPNTIVPYLNLFYGQGRPQSLARAGIAGGILTNTGLNFETDGITGYPTLDATGNNTFGFASGVNLLGSQFSHQLVLEFAMLQAFGPALLRSAPGDQYALGVRYQKPLSHNLIFRTDHMGGIRENASNLFGSRFELRWKF
ncbi:MAG: hypothetical protein KF752_01695 [Pirellulaceae bacterium]|nr:hypothetical protein [Pirellulaceae bacterium]